MSNCIFVTTPNFSDGATKVSEAMVDYEGTQPHSEPLGHNGATRCSVKLLDF